MDLSTTNTISISHVIPQSHRGVGDKEGEEEGGTVGLKEGGSVDMGDVVGERVGAIEGSMDGFIGDTGAM